MVHKRNQWNLKYWWIFLWLAFPIKLTNAGQAEDIMVSNAVVYKQAIKRKVQSNNEEKSLILVPNSFDFKETSTIEFDLLASNGADAKDVQILQIDSRIVPFEDDTTVYTLDLNYQF